MSCEIWISIVGVMVAVVGVVVSIIIAIKSLKETRETIFLTKKQIELASEQFKQNKKALLSFSLIETERGAVYLFVENVGNSSAKNIRFKILEYVNNDKELSLDDDFCDGKMELAPKEKSKCLLRITGNNIGYCGIIKIKIKYEYYDEIFQKEIIKERWIYQNN